MDRSKIAALDGVTEQCSYNSIWSAYCKLYSKPNSVNQVGFVLQNYLIPTFNCKLVHTNSKGYCVPKAQFQMWF